MLRSLHFICLLILCVAAQGCQKAESPSSAEGAAAFVASLPAPSVGGPGQVAPAGPKTPPHASAEASAPLRPRIPSAIAEQLTASAADPTQLDYRIGSLDVLEITVFGVPELTRTAQVTSGGQISLPLIGAVTAARRTPTEVEADIAKRLGETYLQSPQVSVFVKESLSQRVTVSGAVAKPGVFPITGQTTLLQAVAMGGGLVRLADPGAVVVFRHVDGQRYAARFDVHAIGRGQAADPVVLAGDVVIVDESGARSTLKDITEGLPIIALFVPLLLLL